MESQELKKGDIVLLINERKTRLHWPIARVEELIFSRDNKARSALLRLPSEDKPVSKKEANETGNDVNKKKWHFAPPKFIKRGVETLALLESDLTNSEPPRQNKLPPSVSL